MPSRGFPIDESRSGVGTIVGVATSIAAFVGAAQLGPIGQPVHLLGYADFESAFGGLQSGAELPYAVRQFFANGGTEAYAVRIATDANEPVDASNVYVGDRASRHGIYALEAVDLFNLLVLPGVTDSNVLAVAAAYCEERRAFLVIDAPPLAQSPEAMVAVANGAALPKSDHAAVYFPWLRIADPLDSGKLRLTPPSGTVAGLYARTDAQRGVWKAPAGTDATLNGVRELAYALTDVENASLNALGVDCLRLFPAFGVVAWGARTLLGADVTASEYKYVPVRRLALYIEESLVRGLRWVVFEPNEEALWAHIRLNADAFMYDLFRTRAFQGTSPRDAYFVKCDNETTTQADIDRGVVNILVGFAPLKPAEFVVIRIQQLAGQLQT